MNILLSLCLLLALPFSASADAAVVKGRVLETMNAGGYTYLRLKTGNGETWAAVNRASVSKGAEVTIENAMEMRDFESRSLKRTFPKILFGSLGAGAGTAPASAGMNMGAAHASLARTPGAVDVHVPKAVGANARTVAEIVAKRVELKDKPVLLRARVVKYNAGIMGKNWLHVRDGSGSAANDSNDLLVISTHEAKLGDVVSVKGFVRVDQDFGAGYAYKVLVEGALVKP